MSNIFKSNTEGPQCPPTEATAAQIAAIGAGYYGFLNLLVRTTELAFKNTLDAEVQLYLQNPADPAQTKWPWIKLAANETFALQSNYAPQTWLPAHTWIWVKPTGGAPTTGKLTVVYQGG